MKKALLLTSLLLTLFASAALAGGMDLGWGTVCFTEATDQGLTKTFLCTTNSTSAPNNWPMTLSFMIDQELPDMVGVEIHVVAQSLNAPLPQWWHFEASPPATVAGCRVGLLLFSGDPANGASDLCADWVSPSTPIVANGWFSNEDVWHTGDALDPAPTYPEPNCGRLKAGIAIPATSPFPMLAGQEYFAARITLKNGKTVNSLCTGCLQKVAIDARLMKVAGLSGTNIFLTGALANGNKTLYWQGFVTPTKNATWSQVKNLYR